MEAEIAALVTLYVNSKPEAFRLSEPLRSSRLPTIELWSGIRREATLDEWRYQSRHVKPDRLLEILSGFKEGSIPTVRGLLYDSQSHISTLTPASHPQSELASKSIRRVWTSFSHQYLDADGCLEPAPVYSVTFDKSGKFIFTGADDWLVRQFQVSTGDLVATLHGHQGEICDMSVSACNRILASAAADRLVKLWRFSDGVSLGSLRHEADVPWVNFNPTESEQGLLITATDAGVVSIWSVKLLEEVGDACPPLRRLELGGGRGSRIRGFAVSPFRVAGGSAGFSFAIAPTDKTIKVFSSGKVSLPALTAETSKLHHGKPVTQISFAVLSTDLASSDDSGSVVLWLGGTPKPLLTSTLSGSDCALADGSALSRVVGRVGGVPGETRSLGVDMTAWVDADRRLAVSLTVCRGRQEVVPVVGCVLLFSVRSGELTSWVDSFADRIFILKPLPFSAMLVGSHDGSLVFYSVQAGGLTATNRFEFSRSHRGSRKLLDASVHLLGAGGYQIALSDSRGCVSLLSAAGQGAAREQFLLGDYTHGQVTGVLTGGVVNSRGGEELGGNELLSELPSRGSGYHLRLGVMPARFVPDELILPPERPLTPAPEPPAEEERQLNDFLETRDYYMDSSFSEGDSSESVSSSDNTSLASEESDQSRVRRVRRQTPPRRSTRSRVEVVTDLWLSCDACNKWRKVSQEIYDQYDGTNKRVRCRHINRKCEEPPDEAAVPDSAPAVEAEPARVRRRMR